MTAKKVNAGLHTGLSSRHSRTARVFALEATWVPLEALKVVILSTIRSLRGQSHRQGQSMVAKMLNASEPGKLAVLSGRMIIVLWKAISVLLEQ